MWYLPGFITKEIQDLRARAASKETKTWMSTIQQINRQNDGRNILTSPANCDLGNMQWVAADNKNPLTQF